MGSRRFATAVLATVGLVTAGCGAAAGDKSGGTGPAQVLVLANNDGSGLDGAPAVARFVEQVAHLSGGRLTIRVASRWQGGGDEARVIRDVADGQADLGWSGTRAFDTVGITDFKPLHAPFLVNSYPAEAAVVKDPVAGEMLGSLRRVGLTGLALAADELRMPAAAKPLLTTADFRDLRFGTIASTAQSDALQALGAQPVTVAIPHPPETDNLDGVETMWWTYQANAQYASMPFVTANAVLWPRTVALFANARRLQQLDPSGRDWIQRAAADASTWSTQHAGDSAAGQIRASCSSGTRIVTATPDQLSALRTATEPVYAAMRADPAIARTLTRIQALVTSLGSTADTPVPPGCAYQPGDEHRAAPAMRTLTGPGRAGNLPPGTYRFALSVQELLAHGASANDAQNNAGVYTWTLQAGSWRYNQKFEVAGRSGPGAYSTCEGWYDVEAATASFTTSTHEPDGGTCAPPVWSARWSNQNSTIIWSNVSDPDFAYVWAGKPWQRIG